MYIFLASGASMTDLLFAGGPFMLGTLAVSLLSVGIFIAKAWFFWGKARSKPALLLQVTSYVEGNDIARALRVCSADESSMAKVLKAALQRANRSEKEIRRAVEGVALEEIPRIRSGTVLLPQLSNLATLFGLIGTIHGLIISFSAAGGESAATRQAMLSKGISIAFYNTFFGLTVATIAVVLYLILLSKTNSTMALLEKSAASVLDGILWFRDQSQKSA